MTLLGVSHYILSTTGFGTESSIKMTVLSDVKTTDRVMTADLYVISINIIFSRKKILPSLHPFT